MNKIKVLEVDQWTSTGSFKGLTMADFEKDREGTLLKVKGGDAEAARVIFGGRARVIEVSEDNRPDIGSVWLQETNGQWTTYKCNYDSSD